MGVGPLIHAPFLLEHSFWGILGSSSDVTAGRRVFVCSAVGGWGWAFLRLWVRVLVRERLGPFNQLSSWRALFGLATAGENSSGNTGAPEPSSVAHINASFTHIPLML